MQLDFPFLWNVKVKLCVIVSYLQLELIFPTRCVCKTLSSNHTLPVLSWISRVLVLEPSNTKSFTYGIVVITVTPSEQTTFEFSIALLTATTDIKYVPSSDASKEANVLYVFCVYNEADNFL